MYKLALVQFYQSESQMFYEKYDRLNERKALMDTQIISFKTGPSQSGNGFLLPEGSNIPKMRGRNTLRLSVEIQHLDEALELLSGVSCSFWACRGATKPKHMLTCSKCYAMREVSAVRATLINSQGVNPTE